MCNRASTAFLIHVYNWVVRLRPQRPVTLPEPHASKETRSPPLSPHACSGALNSRWVSRQFSITVLVFLPWYCGNWSLSVPQWELRSLLCLVMILYIYLPVSNLCEWGSNLPCDLASLMRLKVVNFWVCSAFYLLLGWSNEAGLESGKVWDITFEVKTSKASYFIKLRITF